MRLFAQRSINDSRFWQNFGDGSLARTEAGVRVTHDSALSDDAVLAAVSLLAGTIANLPWKAYVTNGELTQLMESQPSWLEAPDPLDAAITDVVHKTQVAIAILLAGNNYTYCEPNVFNPVRLTVLDPTRVRVIKPNMERQFRVMQAVDGDPMDKRDTIATLSSAQVLHTPYLLRPGRLEGLSPIEAQTGNIGVSIALRKWMETFFGKGGQVAGFVSIPPEAQQPAIAQVKDRIAKRLAGWRNAGVIDVLSGGATWVKTGLSPQDADLGNLWGRQLEMVARVFGIPPFMIGSQEPGGIAYASTVERSQHYIDYCVMRYTRPIEKAYSRLVPGDGRLQVPGSNTEVRFNFDALLRGDPKARAEQFAVELNSRQITLGEVRAKNNRPQYETFPKGYLEGPDGFLQTPNNTPQGAQPPAEGAAAPTEKAAP